MIPIVNEADHQVTLPVVPLILSEVNTRSCSSSPMAMGVLVKRIKPDSRSLGPRYGKIMKAGPAVVAEFT